MKAVFSMSALYVLQQTLFSFGSVATFIALFSDVAILCRQFSDSIPYVAVAVATFLSIRIMYFMATFSRGPTQAIMM